MKKINSKKLALTRTSVATLSTVTGGAVTVDTYASAPGTKYCALTCGCESSECPLQAALDPSKYDM